MISALRIQNFTAFRDVAIELGSLNVIHGENGTGKTHLLKLCYAIEHAAWGRSLGGIGVGPGSHINTAFELSSALEHVFACESGAQLLRWGAPALAIEANSGTNGAISVSIDAEGHEVAEGPTTEEVASSGFGQSEAVYIPAAEVLTRDPRVTALFGRFDVREDGAVKDLLQQVHSPVLRGQIKPGAQRLLARLRDLIGGTPLLDPESGSVYIETRSGARLDAALAAQGHLKLATLALLLERIELAPGLVLCWDEPESNLNPALVRELAPVLVELAQVGVQVILATHSLFLIRELYLLTGALETPLDTRYIGLHPSDDGVTALHGPRVEESGDVIALDEALEQADRYLDLEAGVALEP